ncbi:MAG: murein biosynthesis integral membrane protein MurJ, partial [Candidatus Saccharibacteria bacterium]
LFSAILVYVKTPFAHLPVRVEGAVMSTKKTVVKAAVVILVISILARVLGLVRDIVVGHYFGTSTLKDALVTASKIPDAVYAIIGGALFAAFIPVFTATDINKGRAEASRVASYTANIAIILTSIITVVCVVMAPWIIKHMVPGWSAEVQALTVNLTRILMPCILINTVMTLQKGILNSFQHFAAPTLTSVVYTATVIASVYLLAPSWGIYGLAVGILIAALTQIFVQLPPMFGRGLHYTPKIAWDSSELRRIGELIYPVLIQLAISQIYIVFIESVLVSQLPSGSVSSLDFGRKLRDLPFNLFVMTINTAVLPSMAEMAAKKDYDGLGETTVFGINLISLFTLPAAVGLFVLATPIVQLLFQHGAFDARSTAMTAFALQFFVIGLFAMGVFNVLYRAFYSIQDTRTPVIISIVIVFVNGILAWLLMKSLQHGGLALASSLAATVNMILAYWYLRRKLPTIPEKRMFVNLGKMLLASALMGLGVYAIDILVSGLLPAHSFIWQALSLAVSMGIGIIAYLLLVVVLRVEEAWYVYQRIASRLVKR